MSAFAEAVRSGALESLQNLRLQLNKIGDAGMVAFTNAITPTPENPTRSMGKDLRGPEQEGGTSTSILALWASAPPAFEAAVAASQHLKVRSILRNPEDPIGEGRLAEALIKAVEKVDESMVVLLLHFGADPKVSPSDRGYCAQELAERMLVTHQLQALTDPSSHRLSLGRGLANILLWFDEPKIQSCIACTNRGARDMDSNSVTRDAYHHLSMRLDAQQAAEATQLAIIDVAYYGFTFGTKIWPGCCTRRY